MSEAVRRNTIVGGTEADRLAGGSGNDIFLVGEKDLVKGTETVNGGKGKDRIEFPFKRPRGLRCRGETVRFSKGKADWVVRSVERIRFKGRGC